MNNRLSKNVYEYCTGCRACGDICPVNAISFEDNHEGFAYPIIDDDKCINCGKCSNKCPVLNKPPHNMAFTPIVYSVASRDSELRGASTSGGVFGELAREIISQGGVVCGCSYTDDYKEAKHIIVEHDDDLYKLIGTKYFQSNTENIYSRVKEFLDKGRIVLFAGTPCQNAALRNFLERDYSDLYQMDFVCNSISSPLAYRKWLEDLEVRYKSAVEKVRFKDKREGWSKLNTEVYFKNGVAHHEDRNTSLWGKGLIKYNLYQRNSCYDCKFRNMPNYVADITVGDFWGLNDLDDYNNAKGVSLVVINSHKGENLFKSVKRKVLCKKRTLCDVINGNPRSVKNPVYCKERDDFFKLLQEKSFSESVELCTGEKYVSKIKSRLTLKELKQISRDKRVSLWQYLYLNYFSHNVVRFGTAKIIPFKNSVFDLHKDARIILHGNRDFYVGKNKLKKSHAETFLRMEQYSTIELFRGGELLYGVTMEVKKCAKFSSGWFGLNTGSTLVCQNKIQFGDNVMCGRNSIVLDSDFHQIKTTSGAVLNPPGQIFVGDNVWVTGDVRILPGSKIGSNSIIGSFVIINDEIPDWSIVSAGGEKAVTRLNGAWSKDSNNIILKNVNSKADYAQILVGFGVEGKEYFNKQSQFIKYVIDNNSTDERAITFEKFCEMNMAIDNNTIFVIGSSKYYEELEKMIKRTFKTAIVVSAKTVMHNRINIKGESDGIIQWS